MKTTALIAILLAINIAAFAQAPERSTGKPQVTTFMHQTLGESIEDFMRTSGTKMCASPKPEAAQWCETLKKIEAGERGVVTDKNANASVSMVFVEKKLVQVLVQGQADWDKSIAEFTQQYGAPDTLIGHSAEWAFSDGGGIAVSGQQGNSFTATFFCKDGKPKEEKATATAPAADPTASRNGAKQWRTGRVREITTTRAQMNNREVSVPAVWISETDGDRSYLILSEAAYSRTHIVFHVGDTVQCQRAGETATINGFLDIRYVNDKGKEKSELHMIANVR
jgi:hypothetical protein